MNRIISKLTSIVRWQIACLLDRFPSVCWAGAVTWAQFPEDHPFSEIFELRYTAGRCGAGGDAPYCGKCAVLAGREGQA